MKKSTNKKYYWIEFSEEAAELFSKSCLILANIMSGNLTALKDVLLDAIKQREGRDPSEHEIIRIEEVCKALQFEVFDSTYGKTKNIHRVSDTVDALCDMVEVINYQFRKEKREGYETAQFPCGWSDVIPLIRIISVRSSCYNRRKTLKTYKDEL